MSWPSSAALKEAREPLHVRAKAMIVSHDHPSIGTPGSRENPLHATGREGERPLAEHVNLRRQGTQHVRLVQVIGRGNHDRIQSIELEEVLDVRHRVSNAESIGECASLGLIAVAHRNQLGSAHLGEDRKVGELGNGSSADYTDAGRVFHCGGFAGFCSPKKYPPPARSWIERNPLSRSARAMPSRRTRWKMRVCAPADTNTPAAIASKERSTNVPCMRGPSALRTCADTPPPMNGVIQALGTSICLNSNVEGHVEQLDRRRLEIRGPRRIDQAALKRIHEGLNDLIGEARGPIPDPEIEPPCWGYRPVIRINTEDIGPDDLRRLNKTRRANERHQLQLIDLVQRSVLGR